MSSIDSEFAKIMHNEWVVDVTNEMDSRNITADFSDGTSITLTELDWFKFVGDLARMCNWAMQVMTWHDMERIIEDHVGWSDNEDMTADKRRDVFFEKGVALTDQWRDPSTAWSPIGLAASVLTELGYFDTPMEMMEWTANAFEKHAKFMQALTEGDDDDDNDDD